MNISIITIHLNDFDGLYRTYLSVKPFLDGINISWVVIDGGSKVKTEEQKSWFDLVSQSADYFSSEPDQGIYDAMNKGSLSSQGEYLLFLNAGDELHPDFNHAKLADTVKDSRPDMIWGRSQQQYQNNSRINIKTRSLKWAWYGMPVFHSAVFFLREKIGSSPYDTHYRIAADYDLICRLLTSGAAVVQADVLVSIFHRGGVSDTSGKESLKEESEIRGKYFNVPPILSSALVSFKRANAQLSQVSWLRRLWRRWI